MGANIQIAGSKCGTLNIARQIDVAFRNRRCVPFDQISTHERASFRTVFFHQGYVYKVCPEPPDMNANEFAFFRKYQRYCWCPPATLYLGRVISLPYYIGEKRSLTYPEQKKLSRAAELLEDFLYKLAGNPYSACSDLHSDNYVVLRRNFVVIDAGGGW